MIARACFTDARQKQLFMVPDPSSDVMLIVIVDGVFFVAYCTAAMSSEAFAASGAKRNAT